MPCDHTQAEATCESLTWPRDLFLLNITPSSAPPVLEPWWFLWEPGHPEELFKGHFSALYLTQKSLLQYVDTDSQILLDYSQEQEAHALAKTAQPALGRSAFQHVFLSWLMVIPEFRK